MMLTKNYQDMIMTKNNVLTAYDLILQGILNKDLKPGEVVTEISLAERFKIGRTPVREALRKLEMEGLIQTENRTKRVHFLTPEDIDEIFEIKIAIEGHLALRAAERITEAQINELSNIVLNMKELLTSKEQQTNEEFLAQWLKYDNHFHDLIFKITNNKRSEEIRKRLNLQWHRLKVGLSVIEGRIETAVEEHTQIAEAIISKNGTLAQQKMQQHLDNLKQVLIGLMRAFQ